MRHVSHSLTAWFVVAIALVVPRHTHAADKPTDPNEPPTTRITFHPAEPPAIAMQHRLLPRYFDLIPGNAAVQYLKFLPEGGDATIKKHAERMGELLDQDRKDFQIDEARKVINDFGGSAFEYMRLASVREDCDWDLPVREHDLYAILLPELQSMRQLGRYLALRARLQIADGEIDKAVETLRVGYALARNTAKGPTLVNALVSGAITRVMNQSLVELMQSSESPNLYWSIAALPDPFIDTRRAMDFEGDGIYLMFPQLKDVATTKLTDDQWSLRLAEFGQSLSRFGSLLGTDAEGNRWQEKLALGVKLAAVAAVHYPQAKTDLQMYGWSKAQLDSMAVAQVILLHIGQTNEVLRDSMFKWFHIPYWQSQNAISEAERQFADTVKSREILPFASLLLPAINAARSAVVRVDREFAALRAVEALRFYAAKHDRKLPEKLEDIKEVPVPLDPVFGKPFDYKLEGAIATLEGKAPEGRSAESGAFRYFITIADKKAGEIPRDPPPPKPDNKQSADKQIQKVVSGLAKTFIDVSTTNPILAVGENRRRRQSVDNLKNLGLAMHNYHDVHKHFPPAASVDKNGKPLLSWRVHVLPYVDENALYRQFKLDEPWDSEHNKKLIEKMPKVFRVPELPPIANFKTSYLVPVGKETVFHDDKGTSFKAITDGTSQTILVLEADADQAVIWTKPGDWQFEPKYPTRGLGRLRGGKLFLATLADDSVHHLSLESVRQKEQIPKLFTRAGGEKIEW